MDSEAAIPCRMSMYRPPTWFATQQTAWIPPWSLKILCRVIRPWSNLCADGHFLAHPLTERAMTEPRQKSPRRRGCVFALVVTLSSAIGLAVPLDARPRQRDGAATANGAELFKTYCA